MAITAEQNEDIAVSAPAGWAPVRYAFLDGIRGLAALYVLLYHVWFAVRQQANDHVPTVVASWTAWSRYGRQAVGVFIVLSGFCLALPVVRTTGLALKGGVGGYLKRRARRILPPYYWAVAFSLLLCALFPLRRDEPNAALAHMLPAFTPPVLVSHAFLIHNLSHDWIFKIDSALWSVATEWQIYFAFALILLPVWRRVGLAAAVTIAFVLGLIPHFLHRLDLAAFWFLGQFAMGVATAAFVHGRTPRLDALRDRFPWRAAMPVSVAVGVVLIGPAVRLAAAIDSDWLIDTAVAFITCIVIVACARSDGHSSTARLLGSKLGRRFGDFSYSLYLCHSPILYVVALYPLRHRFGATSTFEFLYLVGVPLCIGASYLFHVVFERPYMSASAGR